MHDEITERVKSCLERVLARDPSAMTPESRLMEDLGADSLDLVELMFVLENEFGVQITQDDMRLTHQLGMPEEEIHRDEILTDKALAKLRELFPSSQALLVEGITRRHLAGLLTVEHVARTVQQKLGESGAGQET